MANYKYYTRFPCQTFFSRPKEETAVKLFDFAGYSGAFGIFTFGT